MTQQEQLEAILAEVVEVKGSPHDRETMFGKLTHKSKTKLREAITALIQEAVNEGRVAVPDDIKGVTVSGVATLQNEMDTVSIQDLRLIIDELRPKGSGGSNNG